MILLLRPGQEPLEIDFILIDFDGTLAADRRVHAKTKDKLNLLARRTKIYVLTTHGERAERGGPGKSEGRDHPSEGRGCGSGKTELTEPVGATANGGHWERIARCPHDRTGRSRHLCDESGGNLGRAHPKGRSGVYEYSRCPRFPVEASSPKGYAWPVKIIDQSSMINVQ